jgi:hypothetical protein
MEAVSSQYARHMLFLQVAPKTTLFCLPKVEEPGSSVSIVSDYGLDDRAIAVRSLAGAKDFSSNLCV